MPGLALLAALWYQLNAHYIAHSEYEIYLLGKKKSKQNS